MEPAHLVLVREGDRVEDGGVPGAGDHDVTEPGSTDGDTVPNQPRAIASSRVRTTAREPSTDDQVATTESTAPPAQ